MATKTQLRARCLDCEAMVSVRASAELGDKVTCPECETLLEVINLHPLDLDYAEDDYNDYVDDDYENVEDDDRF